VTHLRDPLMACLFAEGFVYMGVFVATYNYIAFRLLQPPYALSQAAAGAVFSLYLVGMVSSPWAGSLAGRFGRRRTLVLNLILMAGGIALTMLAPLPAVVAGIGLLTFGFFAAHSVTSSWIGLRARERKAQAASLYLCFYYLGASVTGSVGGLFWERLGWPGVAGFLLTLLTAALALARRLEPSADEQEPAYELPA
jgi:YNFM family putative membrane transporter